jgi:hypothetical protein
VIKPDFSEAANIVESAAVLEPPKNIEVAAKGGV